MAATSSDEAAAQASGLMLAFVAATGDAAVSQCQTAYPARRYKERSAT